MRRKRRFDCFCYRAFGSASFCRSSIEVRVDAVNREELLVRADLGDVAVSSTTMRFASRIVERRGDHEGVRSRKSSPRPADDNLGASVHVRRGLVEDEDAGSGEDRAGEADQLSLADDRFWPRSCSSVS